MSNNMLFSYPIASINRRVGCPPGPKRSPLLVCPNCKEPCAADYCNICDQQPDRNNYLEYIDNTGGVEMCVICDKYEAIEGGLCKECNDSFQAYVDNDFTNIIPGGEY